jgi:hypothetical protein
VHAEALIISIFAYNGLSRFYKQANTIQANKNSMQHAVFKGVTPEQKHLKTNRIFETVTTKLQYTQTMSNFSEKKGIGLSEGRQKLVIYRYHANVSGSHHIS